MVKSVIDLKLGERGIIHDFEDDALPIKLLELGCLPGGWVEMVQIAPLKDPIYINLNGSHISIRRSLAQKIPISISQVQTPNE
ncbi:MAG: FeoA family protein [Bacteroidota bacterium]